MRRAMKMPLSIQFGAWIVGGLVVIISAAALVGHSVCVHVASTRPMQFVCEAKVTDLALTYLTYCLVVVGWFGIRSGQEAAEKVERAYLWPGYGLMIEDRDNVRIGIHLGVRNTGRTVGIMKTVHSTLITKEQDDDPKSVITYDVFRGREDAIIPDPNTEARSGIWHRLNVMPKVSRGWITYRDIFGKTHRQAFRYVVHPSGRTDSLPDSFEYQPWNMQYKERPSEQEPLPPNVKTVLVKISETP